RYQRPPDVHSPPPYPTTHHLSFVHALFAHRESCDTKLLLRLRGRKARAADVTGRNVPLMAKKIQNAAYLTQCQRQADEPLTSACVEIIGAMRAARHRAAGGVLRI